MARLSNEFSIAWYSLSGTDIEPGWQVISLATSGPLQVQAGRRFPDNNEAVLIGFPSIRLASAHKLPEGQGFTVERADPDGSGKLWLALTRKSTGNIDLFSVMVCDIVDALDDAVAANSDESQLLRVLIGRVGAWQEFMRKGSQILSLESELGLIGELIFLRSLIKSGVTSSQALESWVGPLDGIQDFQIGTGAFEVKTTLSSVGFIAKIGSLEQLDDSNRQPLFVVGVRLRQIESGDNLPLIVESIRLKIKNDSEAERLLTERLLSAGYIDAHSDLYQRRFEQVEINFIEVTNNFPRLTYGTVPQGIIKTMYEIDLDKVFKKNISLEEALRKMGVN